MATATLPEAPRKTSNPSPVRAVGSVRRTTSIDVSWPDGRRGNRLFQGHARDLLTPASGDAPRVVAAASMEARVDPDRTILSISADPAPAELQKLVGSRGGGHLRMLLADTMPELIDNADPLYLVLDDISGTSLVSMFALAKWNPELGWSMRGSLSDEEFERRMKGRINVCWGLAEGNSGARPDGPHDQIAEANAGELRHPDDAEGWHPFPEFEGAGFRRARRIDVSHEQGGSIIRIDSAFQDSAKLPDGGRVAIHEYNLKATADAKTLEILELQPEARILPYAECPGAVGNTQRLVGKRISDIRSEVLAQLRGTQGCTHLNDALRALAEVPALARELAESE